MQIQSAFNAGVQGFQNATGKANQAASSIVKQTATKSIAPDNSPSLTESIVDLKVAEHQAKASAKVIETADELIGSIVDIKA